MTRATSNAVGWGGVWLRWVGIKGARLSGKEDDVSTGQSERSQLPTSELVGLSVDSRTSRSQTKAPCSFLSKKGLSQVAFSTGVGAARSTSRLRGWLTDSPSIRGLLPLMDVCYRSSRSQIKLTRFLPWRKPVGFRAVTAVTNAQIANAIVSNIPTDCRNCSNSSENTYIQ